MQTFTRESQPKDRMPPGVSNVGRVQRHQRENPILLLQRTIGNQAVQRMAQSYSEEPRAGRVESQRETQGLASVFLHQPVSETLQTKLTINKPGDECEQEADKVAQRLMAGQAEGAGSSTAAHITHLSRESKVSIGEVPASVGQALAGSGHPLEPALRHDMEQRFGYDFSKVRVHSDTAAEKSARDVNADAYTVGSHVVFAPGRFTPGSQEGRRLVAHELTHVIQQSASLEIPTDVGRLDRGTPHSLSAASVLQRDTPIGSQPTPNLDELVLIELAKEAEATFDPALQGARELFMGVPAKAIPPSAKGDQMRPNGGTFSIFGSKPLTKGTMQWDLSLTESGKHPPARDDYRGEPSAQIQVSFKPKPSHGAKMITFIQTKQQSTFGGAPKHGPKIDILKDEYDPFYGATWDPKKSEWTPEDAPSGYKSSPSTAANTPAYLYDAPSAPAGQAKMFESVAVVAETGEVLGALRWGVREGELLGGNQVDCTDAPSADFTVALQKFYATPSAVGPDPERSENYDAIVDGYAPNAVAPTPEQERQLAPIAERVGSNPKLVVVVGGFADATESDPLETSRRRAQAVESYFVRKGVPSANLRVTGFGATWARYKPSPEEGRNRRVQLRLRLN